MTVALTYALPMYRANHIGWLALESLCRQENVNFDWELIILEEEEECMGQKKILSYEERLRAVGCTRIEYQKLPKWIPLSQKWIEMAKLADSVGFLLVGCDDYASPGRLAETKAIFDEGAEFIHSPLGIFYDITSGNLGIWDYSLMDHICGLDKAIKTDILKNALPDTSQRSIWVDGWVYDQVLNFLGRPPIMHTNESDGWQKGLFTDGLNNISNKRRTKYGEKISPPFRQPKKYEPKILKHILPSDIVCALPRLRREALERKGFIK